AKSLTDMRTALGARVLPRQRNRRSPRNRSSVVPRRLIAGICALALALGAFASPAAARGVAFVGDSMADGIWGAFVRLSASQPCPTDFGLYREAQNGTGLTRPDRMDWAEQVTSIGAERQPDIFLISIGLNDQQPIVRTDG